MLAFNDTSTLVGKGVPGMVGFVCVCGGGGGGGGEGGGHLHPIWNTIPFGNRI